MRMPAADRRRRLRQGVRSTPIGYPPALQARRSSYPDHGHMSVKRKLQPRSSLSSCSAGFHDICFPIRRMASPSSPCSLLVAQGAGTVPSVPCDPPEEDVHFALSFLLSSLKLKFRSKFDPKLAVISRDEITFEKREMLRNREAKVKCCKDQVHHARSCDSLYLSVSSLEIPALECK